MFWRSPSVRTLIIIEGVVPTPSIGREGKEEHPPFSAQVRVQIPPFAPLWQQVVSLLTPWLRADFPTWDSQSPQPLWDLSIQAGEMVWSQGLEGAPKGPPANPAFVLPSKGFKTRGRISAPVLFCLILTG